MKVGASRSNCQSSTRLGSGFRSRSPLCGRRLVKRPIVSPSQASSMLFPSFCNFALGGLPQAECQEWSDSIVGAIGPGWGPCWVRFMACRPFHGRYPPTLETATTPLPSNRHHGRAGNAASGTNQLSNTKGTNQLAQAPRILLTPRQAC